MDNFRMRKPPVRPTLESFTNATRSHEICDGDYLSHLIDMVGDDLKGAYVEHVSDYENAHFVLVWSDKEYRQSQYHKAMKRYEKELSKYNEWCKENEILIERRKTAEKIRDQEERQGRINRLEKELKRLKGEK